MEPSEQLDILIDELRALREDMKAQSGPAPKAVNKHDAAKILGVRVRTLDRMIESGEIPVVRFNSGMVRFSN